VNADSKILFLGHDASRTGAPLLLLELIKWLKANSRFQPAVLLKRGGELEPEFQAVAPTQTPRELALRVNQAMHLKVLRKFRLAKVRQPNLAALYPVEEYPVIYANTIDTCNLALQMIGPGRRLVHHIHEMSYTTDAFNATEMLKKAVPVTDVYIAASYSVRGFLVNKIGIPPTKIHVIHEFPIATDRIDREIKTPRSIRQRLGIPEEAFIVGMCGLPQWRKGTDLFVQLASQFKRHQGSESCHFVWLGGDASSQREAVHDVAKLGLQQMCHFVPAVENPESYFKAFDLFALTSREDPFSVAMLEAALSGLPIVCFADAGGGPELVENDAGIIVPYSDVPAMAQACMDLRRDNARRRRMGEAAKAKVLAHYTLEKQGPKILAVLKSMGS
jgi:glycosyltransferase involved in cell wall biosynthesis